MKYTIRNYNKKYDHIEVDGFDDLNDEDLWLLVSVMQGIIDSERIYFEWSRLNFFADNKEQEQNAQLAFKCFQEGGSIQRICTDSLKFKSSLYVGYQDLKGNAKQAMFYAWRAFEDAAFFSSNNMCFENVVCKYKNRTIGYGGKDMLDIIQADVVIFRNDTGDTMLIYARDLSLIEKKLLNFNIMKKHTGCKQYGSHKHTDNE